MSSSHSNTPEWLLLHGGALGDLALSIRLALDCGADRLGVLSRVDPGDLSVVIPGFWRLSTDVVGTDWLFRDDDAPPPSVLLERVRAGRVLCALGPQPELQLARLEPTALACYDPRPRDGDVRHITEQWLAQLEPLGCSRVRSWTPPVRERSASRRVLVHPGGGGPAKCWPLAGFLAAGRLLAESGADVSFVVGPVELERWSPAALAAVRDAFPLTELTTPQALVERLLAADVLLSNDSGPAHLAALLGTSTVTIFGPTDARVWRPMGRRQRVIVGAPTDDAETWGVEPTTAAREVSALLDDATA